MKKLLSLLCITSSIFAMELDVIQARQVKELFVPERLGSIELYHTDKGFSIYHDNKKHDVKKYHVDPMLHNINKKQLKGFLKNGYLSVNQMDDGEYSLKAKGRINGGGPVLGVIMYWLTKSLCYGTALAATSTVVVTTGGAALGLATGTLAGAGGLALTGAAAATTTTAVIGTTAGVVVGGATGAAAVTGAATIVGTAVGATAGANAALITAGVVSSAGGIGATIAGVEAVSSAIGTFFGMLPTP